jgi:hypothetical protein
LGAPGSSIAAFDQDRWARERRLFEVLLPDGHKLWPDWLRKIDTLLEDATGKPRARVLVDGWRAGQNIRPSQRTFVL